MDDGVNRLHEEIDAALAESAPLAWRQAPGSCYRDPETGFTCAPYHRIWQYLGLLGVTTSIRTDTAFLVDVLLALARGGRSGRLLISGAADYGLLARVLWAYARQQATVQVTVLDRCATPLALNRWYARRAGATVETIQADILDHAVSEPFDVICTHSFLGWFSPAAQLRLITAWRRMLRPGGVVITTRRLRSDPPDTPRDYTVEEATRLAERVRRAADRQRERVDVDPEQLAAAAFEYARARGRYPIATAEALCALFERGGLRVVRVDDRASPDEPRDLPSGPPAAAAAGRLRIVAERRA